MPLSTIDAAFARPIAPVFTVAIRRGAGAKAFTTTGVRAVTIGPTLVLVTATHRIMGAADWTSVTVTKVSR